MGVRKAFFKKVIDKPLNDLLLASYLVYCEQCRIHNITPMNINDYGVLIDNELKKLYSKN